MVARKIAVITGSRADYGHLRSLLGLIAEDPDCDLQVVACGQHLSPAFGETWREIKADGFDVAARVDMGLPDGDDSRKAVAEASGRGVTRMADALDDLCPDVVVVLGDRFEIMAAGLAAFLLGIPLAHIHGGEVTEAAMDEGLRHALTKLAHLHFVAAPDYARRVIQMGEPPDRVFTTGAPGLDHALAAATLDRKALSKELELDLGGRFFLVTWHPVTLSDQGVAETGALLAALAAHPEAAILFTGVNSDPGNRAIMAAIEAFVAGDPDRRKAVKNLPQPVYLSALKQADVFVGNSSSGLIEAPALGTVSVNIGTRQKGRLKAGSVLDCPPDPQAIGAAMAMAMDPAQTRPLWDQPPPYGAGGASAEILRVLKTADLATLRVKPFHDL